MQFRHAAAAIVVAATLLVTGCAEPETPRLEQKIVVEPDAAAVALLPEGVSGTLVVAINPEYQPNEYKDEKGELVGWTVDLADGKHREALNSLQAARRQLAAAYPERRHAPAESRARAFPTTAPRLARSERIGECTGASERWGSTRVVASGCDAKIGESAGRASVSPPTAGGDHTPAGGAPRPAGR